MVLVSQKQLASQARADRRSWHSRLFAQLEERLSPPTGFPCLFSQNAFRRELVCFSFVESADADEIAMAAADLEDYVARSRQWDGHLNTAEPLIVAFSPHAVAAASIEDYHAFGWAVLQRWHELDRSPWPSDVATDPHERYWSMCFAGMQLFVNMSSPAHRNRKSRNLGDAFLFIINPRERFDLVAGPTPEGRKVRQKIRDRVEQYNGLPHSPQLAAIRRVKSNGGSTASSRITLSAPTAARSITPLKQPKFPCHSPRPLKVKIGSRYLCLCGVARRLEAVWQGVGSNSQECAGYRPRHIGHQ